MQRCLWCGKWFKNRRQLRSHFGNCDKFKYAKEMCGLKDEHIKMPSGHFRKNYPSDVNEYEKNWNCLLEYAEFKDENNAEV